MSIECRLSDSSAEVRWQQTSQTGGAANFTQQVETWQTFKSGFLPAVKQALFCLLNDFNTHQILILLKPMEFFPLIPLAVNGALVLLRVACE